MNKYKGLGLKSSRSCKLCDIPKSSYYYSASCGNPGRKPSMQTQLKNGTLIKNSKVCDEIISILDHPFVDYGYLKVIHKLRQSYGMIAKDVAEYIKQADIKHKFTHVRTPQENGYVECFHSILFRFLRKRGEFENFFELESVLNNWTEFYNEERLHKGCGYKTPNMVMRRYYDKNKKNVGKNVA